MLGAIMVPVFRFNEGTLVWEGGKVYITPMQATILGCLARRPGHVISYNTLRSACWPLPSDEPVDPDNNLKQHLYRLRTALAPLGLSIKSHYRTGWELLGMLEIDWSAT